MAKLSEYARDVIEDYYDRLHKPDDFTGCWLFVGGTKNGYGQIGISRKIYYLHIVSWAHYCNKGILPEKGIDIHHTCENKRCANPDHLVAIPKKKHVSEHKKKDRPDRFCWRGHDTWECGRWPNSTCKECARISNKLRMREVRKK